MKITTMPDNNKSLAILRDAKIDNIKQLVLYNIVQTLQFGQDFFKIVYVSIEKTADILEHPYIRVCLLYCINENRKTVSRIFKT